MKWLGRMNKFSVIVADCPWKMKDDLKFSETKRGASINYDTISTDELCKLKVNELADSDGCVLALWVLGSMLKDGMRVMESWGFQQKSCFVWNKVVKDPFKGGKETNLNNITTVGMGWLFRQSHELCLIGILGKGIYKQLQNKSQRSVSFDPNFGHSVKPDTLQNRLEQMFPFALENGKCLEIFARRRKPGWVAIGNESPMTYGENINTSIQKLIKISSPEDGNNLSFNHDQQELFELWKKISTD